MKIFIVFVISLFLISCANRALPTGGEGDKTPPTVISVFPQNQSLQTNRNARIAVQFSEWVTPASVESGVMISPHTPFSLRIRGRNVEVRPNKPLSENTTYHVSFLGDISDFFGNNLVETKNIIFSTGDFIDTSFIEGRVFFEISDDGLLPKVALFFEERANLGDSVLLSTPDYITQADSTGNFRFDNIVESSFRIIAFTDGQGLNRVVPGRPVFIGEEKVVRPQSFQELFPATSDTAQNRFLSASAISPTVILVNTKETEFDTLKVFSETDGENLQIKEIKRLEGDGFSMAIFLSDSLQNRLYSLSSQTLRVFAAAGDSVYYDTVRFNGTTIADTLRTAALDALLDGALGITENIGEDGKTKGPADTAAVQTPLALSLRLSWDFLGELPQNPLWELRSGNFVFRTKDNFLENIPAAEYRIWLIDDRNQNGIHDVGTLFPFRAGEKKIAFPDVFTARERWEVEYEFGAVPVSDLLGNNNENDEYQE